MSKKEKILDLITIIIFIGGIIFLIRFFFGMYAGVSPKREAPEYGVWYCEELRLSIDFTFIEYEDECAKIYNEDGTYTVCVSNFGHGNEIFVSIDNQEDYYLSGTFKYKKDLLIVTSYQNHKKYSFVRID